MQFFRKHGWKIIGGIVVLAALLFGFMLFPPAYYLPHQRPVIILPFDAKYDANASIMPMGEKINHPDTPSGHPGIDFAWDNISENIPLIASMDGKVGKIIRGGQYGVDVVIQNGPYQTVYAELDEITLPKNIVKGVHLKQGDLVGFGNFQKSNDNQNLKREMTHWEFGSTSPVIDRFCPLSYFTKESRQRIETIWANTVWPEMKTQYPDICNGDYKGKEG